jgi:RES domain-containing protein
MATRRVRDSRLLDAVELLPVEPYTGIVWRVVGNGREPLRCSSAGGRWDDGTFDVLYTATKADGAVAEMYFHLGQGQPVFPSLLRYRLFELQATIRDCVRAATLKDLESLGISTPTFGRLSFAERQSEYKRTQEVGEAANFHERHGLLVPSARSEHPNLVILCDRAGTDAVEVVKDHGLISFQEWKKTPFGY